MESDASPRLLGLTAPAAARRLVRERAIYAKVVQAMDYPEPSALVHDLASSRQERFTQGQVAERWREAVDGATENTAFNLYVHVPFCKSICDFCNYKRLHVSSKSGLDEFVTFMTREARLFAPALSGAKFGGLFVGGGTPSVLGADHLERLLSTLFESFEFKPGAQKNFEFDPMVMTEDRFKALARFGFTRFSFGIQSVDVEVNRLHNRGAQTRAHLDRQFRLLAEHGAEAANVDFLLGLAGTTPTQMLREIHSVMTEFVPAEICVYFIYPTPEYVRAHFGGDFAKFREFLEPFEREVPSGLRQIAAGAGYTVGGDGKHALTLSAVTRRSRGKSQPRDAEGLSYCDVPSSIHRPLNVLGIGDSARSRIFGSLHYRAEHDHGKPVPEERYAGVRVTLRDEMFGYLCLVFRDANELSLPLFRRTFGRDALDEFAGPLKKLVALGVATVAEDRVTLRPQDRGERLRDLLFFLPKERRSALSVGTLRP